MFGLNRLFKAVNTEVIEPKQEVINIIESEDEVINSQAIQEDIDATFAEVLKGFELDQSKESDIEDLQKRLESFKLENKEIYNKVEKLNTFGFVNTPTAKKTLAKLKDREHKIESEIVKIEVEIKENSILKKRIKEYALKYPTFKFIDNKSMITIMKKYSLVLGETFMYSKEIPDRTLNIIGGFSKEIKSSEKVMQIVKTLYKGRHRVWKVEEKVIEDVEDDFSKQNYLAIQDMNYHSSVALEVSVSKLKMIAPLSHFEIPTVSMSDFRYNNIKVPVARLNLNTNKFELSVRQLVEEQSKIKEVLDPIACLEVKGGYIILDAWDEEANIPEVKNQMLN